MTHSTHIALIDDDEAVLDSLRLFLERRAIRTSCFSGAEAFLAVRSPAEQFDCIVTDVRMPGLSGIDLMRRLAADGVAVPVILITGHGDIDMAVGAIKLGAFDFIEKPFNEERLFDSIRNAVGQRQRQQYESAELEDMRARAESLSERQREVMELAAAGLSNKEIAARLRISPRTVETHRAWMMERMGARSVADLVRMVMRLKAPS